jgi:hypothetical protein
VVRGFERFDHVPGLAFHDGDLAREHALFEIRVLGKDASEGDLSFAPPLLAGEEREEVVAGFLGKGLADEGDGEEEPAKGEASPLEHLSTVQ